MKPPPRIKSLLRAILSGAYTPPDVHEFVQLCYTLALPLIRKKIVAGKLNLEILGLKESDVIYDCLADLFSRDENGAFVKIGKFFQSEGVEGSGGTEEELLIALRRLVFLKVHNNIIRLYSEADPTLGKVLRNVKLAEQKGKLFEETHRFGEAYLIPRNVEVHLQCPPWPLEALEQQFARVALVHDTLLTMLSKLHRIITEQETYQRAVPLVPVALLVRRVYALGWEAEEETESVANEHLQQEDVALTARRICQTLEQRMYNSYVVKQKCTNDLFQTYLRTVQQILLHEFSSQEMDGMTYFELLKGFLPELTKQDYARKHRKIIEYLAKTAKQEMQHELRKS